MEEFIKAFEEYCGVPGIKSNKPGSYAKGIQYLCEYLNISEINEDSIKRIEEIKGYVSDRNSAFYHELLTFLDDALDTLTERELAIVILRYYHGLSHKEVAKKMQLSYVNVRQICHVALEKLRKEMEK